MEQQEVKDDAITPESNPIAYTLSVTPPTRSSPSSTTPRSSPMRARRTS